jgi:hypothetical protein
MHAKKIMEIVDDYQSWRGNSFTLATMVSEAAKQHAADIAVEAGNEAIAQLILES